LHAQSVVSINMSISQAKKQLAFHLCGSVQWRIH